MAEMLTGVNGEIIKWAREYYNMTQSDAALAIGVDIGRYCNWEDGTESPTYAKLRKISEVFHKPSALFFFPEPPQLPTIKGDLRTLPDEVVDGLSRNVIRQFEKAQAYQLNLRELYGNKPSVLSRRADFPTDINELCDYFRLLLAFPIAAQKARKSAKVVFEIFREKFYELGIYVFKDAFKDNSVSGLCLNDDQYPIIIINNSMSFARQIFTLFHELYHLISNTSGAEIIRDDFYVYLNEQQTNSEKLKLCLDIGHVNAYSALSVMDWLEMWAPYISHFHIHNNDGSGDQHNALTDGTIPMEQLLSCAQALCPEATYTLELMKDKPSVEWLAENNWI